MKVESVGESFWRRHMLNRVGSYRDMAMTAWQKLGGSWRVVPLLWVVWTVGVLPTVAQDLPMGIRWREPVEVARGEAHRGPWQQNESDFRYVDDPSVAIDDAGAVTVVWVDQARKDVFLQVFGPDDQPRLAQPVNVSRSPNTFSWLPRVVVSRQDSRQIFVVWQEIVFSGGSHGGDILFARSEDGGRTFTSPVNLSNSRLGSGKGRTDPENWDNGSLDLVQDVDGNLYVAWTDYEGPLWFVRSTDRGNRFSRPLQVAGQDGTPPARAPSLAVGPVGAIYLVWTVGDDRGANLRLARSTNRGETFGEARVITTGPGYADAPKLAVDRRGQVHVVYAEGPAGQPMRTHIRYLRSTDGGDRFDEPREISRERGLPLGPGAGFPSLALDREGRLFVTWEWFTPQGDWTQGLGGALSGDGGRRFGSPTNVPHSRDAGVNGSQQGLLMRKLAVNATGAVAVVNSSFRPGQGSRVWLIRGQQAR
jgi:hypothetical protein